MVETLPNSSDLDKAPKSELVRLLTEIGDPLVVEQISFPFIPKIEELKQVTAEAMEITRLKCHIARAIETQDPIYTKQHVQENPEYFSDLKKTEKFLKGRGF